MIQELIIALGGSAILLGAVAFLTRSIILHFLSKDVETFKQKLSQQSVIEVEKLKHDLRLVATEREKQMALLHEKRATVIAELYGHLVEFVGAAEDFVAIIEFAGEPSKLEKGKVLDEKARQLHGFFIKNEIYFSERITKKVHQLFKEVMGSSRQFGMWLQMSHRARCADAKMDAAWDAAWNTIRDTMPPLMAEIKQEFRALLGVRTENEAMAEPDNEAKAAKSTPSSAASPPSPCPS